MWRRRLLGSEDLHNTHGSGAQRKTNYARASKPEFIGQDLEWHVVWPEMLWNLGQAWPLDNGGIQMVHESGALPIYSIGGCYVNPA